MIRKTSFLLTFFVTVMTVGSAYSVTVSKTYVDKQDKTLFNNQVILRDMLNSKDADGNWLTLDTEEQLAIPAINELHAEMEGKQDVITAENPLPAESVSGLADVAKTGSYESLSDKPEIPSTENLATKEELQVVQGVVGDAEAGLVKQVADNTAAIAGKADTSALETAVADLEEKIDSAVIDASNIDLSGYAKTADVESTYATKVLVEAIDNRVETIEQAGYQNATDVQGAITTATADLATKSDLGGYVKTDELGVLATKDSVTTNEIEAKAVTLDKIAANVPANGETLLMSVDEAGNVTWLSVEILK